MEVCHKLSFLLLSPVPRQEANISLQPLWWRHGWSLRGLVIIQFTIKFLQSQHVDAKYYQGQLKKHTSPSFSFVATVRTKISFLQIKNDCQLLKSEMHWIYVSNICCEFIIAMVAFAGSLYLWLKNLRGIWSLCWGRYICVFFLPFSFFVLSEQQPWCVFPVLWFLSCCGSTRGSWNRSSILSFHQLLIPSGPKKQSKRLVQVTKKFLKRLMELAK